MKPVFPKSGYEPARLRVSDAVAIQAIAGGTATEEQQRSGIKWILDHACALPVWAYRESQRESDIALGRHFVGQHIVSAMNANVSKLKKAEEKEHG